MEGAKRGRRLSYVLSMNALFFQSFFLQTIAVYRNRSPIFGFQLVYNLLRELESVSSSLLNQATTGITFISCSRLSI